MYSEEELVGYYTTEGIDLLTKSDQMKESNPAHSEALKRMGLHWLEEAFRITTKKNIVEKVNQFNEAIAYHRSQEISEDSLGEVFNRPLEEWVEIGSKLK